MIELERTYLAKFLPKGLGKCKNVEIIDNYLPEDSGHPVLRLRKYGGKLELTKKEPLVGADSSEQKEQTIKLSPKEYQVLVRLPGKRLHKVRYYYPYKDAVAEFDIYKGGLEGLVTIDFEFDAKEAKDNFKMPEFCLADVTQALFIAGGKLCGATYADIKAELGEYGYKRLAL